MKGNGSRWTSLAALLVFALFAICLMLVLLTGAGSYRRLADRGEAGFAQQTAAQYISTRFHQGREPEIQDFGGCQALVFGETYGSQTYLTRVYCLDGNLMELFSAESARLSPEDGEKILALASMELSRQGDVFTVTLDGNPVILTRREGRQVPHAE